MGVIRETVERESGFGPFGHISFDPKVERKAMKSSSAMANCRH
jgi:hypothetical protein